VVGLSALGTVRLYLPGKIPGTHFCERRSRTQDHSAAGRVMAMKNFNDTIGNWTRDLPACSAVSQPTAPPLNVKLKMHKTVSEVRQMWPTTRQALAVPLAPCCSPACGVRTGSSCRAFLNKTARCPEDSAGFWNCNRGGENDGTNTKLFLESISASSLRVQS